MNVQRPVTRILATIAILAAAAVVPAVAVSAATPAAPAKAAKAAQTTQGSLASVSGTSARDIWAVGANASGGGTLTEHWNGVRWSAVPSPSPGTGEGRINQLSGVAAVSPTDVWAVGTYASGPHESDVTGHGLIEHWNGTRWSKVACPCGSNNSGGPILSGISAVSRSDIWAVGTGASGPLILHWNGRKWAAVPLSGAKGDQFTAVSATSAGNVWAVGIHMAIGPVVTAHWNGRKWSLVPAKTSATFNDLRAVAASSSRAWAGGQTSRNAVEAFQWNGRKWSAAKVTPGPGTFDGIATVPGGSPWAVGFLEVRGRSVTNVIARWTGSSWVTVPSPDVRQSDNFLEGVWASSARSVWAVGFAEGPKNLTQILHWNGKSWSQVTH